MRAAPPKAKLVVTWPFHTFTSNFRKIGLEFNKLYSKIYKYDLWPYKRRNNEGSITKDNVCLQLPIIHIHTKFEKNPYRNTASRVETRTPTKCDLWPYISRNTGGSNTKNNRCLGCPMIHLHSKFEINPSRNEEVIVYTSIYAHVYPCTATFDPITDGTMRAASPKTIGVFIYP